MKIKDKADIVVRMVYPQGDNFYVQQTKKNDWILGYTNDYPLQHGKGEECRVSESFIQLAFERICQLKRITEVIIGAEVEEGDIIKLNNEWTIYNSAMILPLEKKYEKVLGVTEITMALKPHYFEQDKKNTMSSFCSACGQYFTDSIHKKL